MNTQAVTGTVMVNLGSPSKILRKIAKLSYRFATTSIVYVKTCANFTIDWIVWLMQTSIVRSVAPNERPLYRHEYESVEIRRGGFGNVF